MKGGSKYYVLGPVIEKYFRLPRKDIVIRDFNSLVPLIDGKLVIENGKPKLLEVIAHYNPKKSKKREEIESIVMGLPQEIVVDVKGENYSYYLELEDARDTYSESPKIDDPNKHIAFNASEGVWVGIDKKVLKSIEGKDFKTVEADMDEAKKILEKYERGSKDIDVKIKTNEDGYVDLEALGRDLSLALGKSSEIDVNAKVFIPKVISDVSFAVDEATLLSKSGVIEEPITCYYVFIKNAMKGMSPIEEKEFNPDKLKTGVKSRYLVYKETLEYVRKVVGKKQYMLPEVKIFKKTLYSVSTNENAYLFVNGPIPLELESMLNLINPELLSKRYIMKDGDRKWTGIEVDQIADNKLEEVISNLAKRVGEDPEVFKEEAFGEKNLVKSVFKKLVDKEYRLYSGIISKAFEKTKEDNYKSIAMTMLDSGVFSDKIKEILKKSIRSEDKKLEAQKLRTLIKGEIITRLLMTTLAKEGYSIKEVPN